VVRSDSTVPMCIDRVLRRDGLIRAASDAIAERPTNAPAAQPLDTVPPSQRYRLAVETKKAWKPGRVLRVYFLDSDPKLQTDVMSIACEWTRHAFIRLEQVQDEDAEVRVSLKGAGFWSTVGVDCGAVPRNEPTMQLGGLSAHTRENEFRRVVLHEFGHVLGCIHEHQHPNAGIPWDRKAVYAFYGGAPNWWSKQETKNNVLDVYSETRAQHGDFDKDSIMLYPISKELTGGKYEIPWNEDLSDEDRHFIGTRYPKLDSDVIAVEVGSGATAANITAPGETHKYAFTVFSPGVFTVETSGNTQVAMTLFGPDVLSNLVAANQDGGLGGNAKIENYLMSGLYLVEIRHQRPTGTGKYKLTVSATQV
jgi:hypothetical protein